MPRGRLARRGIRRRRGRRGGLGAVGGLLASVDRSLMDARQQLVAHRDLIERKIAAIDAVVSGAAAPRAAVAAGAMGRRGRRRGAEPRAGSLKDYILRVLSGGGVMAVKDITSSVLQAGYKSRNKTLSKSVGIALTQLSGVTKVGRGKFRLR